MRFWRWGPWGPLALDLKNLRVKTDVVDSTRFTILASVITDYIPLKA
jgi:hypothetical protein